MKNEEWWRGEEARGRAAPEAELARGHIVRACMAYLLYELLDDTERDDADGGFMTHVSAGELKQKKWLRGSRRCGTGTGGREAWNPE